MSEPSKEFTLAAQPLQSTRRDKVIMSPRTPVLFVTWRSPKTHSIIPVGRLIYRDDKLRFRIYQQIPGSGPSGIHAVPRLPLSGPILPEPSAFPLFANRVCLSTVPSSARTSGRAFQGKRRSDVQFSPGPVEGEKPIKSKCSHFHSQTRKQVLLYTLPDSWDPVHASTHRRGSDRRP